jgi:alkylated DNA repair dioxygenase AlkB
LTKDLFVRDGDLIPLDMEDADVSYMRSMSLPASPGQLLLQLVSEIKWRQEEVVIWGKRHAQPRLIAWHGDEARTYTYSGIQLSPVPWTNVLLQIRRSVELACQSEFNSVLLNYYRNERDSMGFHSDDEKELGQRPVIASVSLGETRQLIFQHKTRNKHKTVKLDLESGSLLLMKGDTQPHWKHGIAKQSKACGPRVNLTFRRIVEPSCD